MILTMNQKEMELGGKYLGWLREANDLLGDREALQARLEEDWLSAHPRLARPGEGQSQPVDSSSKSWTKRATRSPQHSAFRRGASGRQTRHVYGWQ